MKEILNAIEALLGKWLGVDPTAIVIFLVPALGLIYWRFKYYQDVLKSPLGLAGVRERLAAHGGWRKAYFAHLRRARSWVDKGLGPSAWSAESYEFTLTMAYIYPFASLFIVWIVTGQNTSGISALLPEVFAFWRCALAAIAVCASTYFFYRLMTSPGWWPMLGNAVAGVVAGALAGDVAFAVVVVGAVVAAAAGAGDVAGVVPMAFAGAVTVAVVAAGAGDVAVAGVVPIAVAGVVVAVGVLLFQEFMNRRGLKGLFYWLYISFILGLLAFVCSHPGWLPAKPERIDFLLIFLVILPLMNSIFDWLSLASTRWLLKNMAARNYASAFLAAGNAISGVVLGVLLLAGLAVTITAALQTMNLLSQGHGGPELFDLAGSLHRLRANPSDVSVWWVYFTLFSTMLPTVFHATVASASFVTWRLPDSWQKHWLNLIDTGNLKDDHRLLVGMSWRLTGIDVLTVILAALATAVLAWLLFWLMPHEGRGLLWLCEKVAEWLGAPITV